MPTSMMKEMSAGKHPINSPTMSQESIQVALPALGRSMIKGWC